MPATWRANRPSRPQVSAKIGGKPPSGLGLETLLDFQMEVTLDGERPLVLDPGCGSGTFLMSAYDCIANRSGLAHKDVLSIVWGFDISPFAAELAAINLFRQDLSEFDNFPRVVPGNFFDRLPAQPVEFPPPRVTAWRRTPTK